MSGHWPPEWEDSDTGLPAEWNADDALDADYPDQEASEVTSFLASVPSPGLPSAFEARISAAIAAEAAARSAGTEWWSDVERPAGTESAGTESASTESVGTPVAGADPAVASGGAEDAEITDRSARLGGFSAGAAESGSGTAAKRGRRRTSTSARGGASRSRPTGSRPGGRRRWMPSSAVTAPLVICLVIVGFAVMYAKLGGSSSSSVADAPPAMSSPSVAGGAAPSNMRLSYGEPGQGGQFAYIESSTRYQRATLVSQVRGILRRVSAPLGALSHLPTQTKGSASAASAPAPIATAAPSAATRAPSAANGTVTALPSTLAGCVSGLTGGVTPTLVDRASYDGSPAYIIAAPNRVWVVRLDCTAVNSQVITSASLTG